MSGADYLDLGQWNFNCSMCGAKFKSSEGLKHWQGQYRCSRCWEPRQPQDSVRAVPDNQVPPWTQVAGQTFIGFCSFTDQSAIPHRAIPGCVIPGFVSPNADFSGPYID